MNFTSASSPTIIKGTDELGTNHVFEVAGVPVECESAHFEGTVQGTAVDQVTVHPVLHRLWILRRKDAPRHQRLRLRLRQRHSRCRTRGHEHRVPRDRDVIETEACTLVIGDQTTDPGLAYTNVAGGDITLTVTMPNIETPREGPLCLSDPSEVPTNIAITTP